MEKKLENLESLLSLHSAHVLVFFLGDLPFFFFNRDFASFFLVPLSSRAQPGFFWLTRSILKKTETVFFKLAPHAYSSSSPLRVVPPVLEKESSLRCP
jgi:hypothetical protein